jgi:hypothetical protein
VKLGWGTRAEVGAREEKRITEFAEERTQRLGWGRDSPDEILACGSVIMGHPGA